MPKQVTGPLKLVVGQSTAADWESQEFPAAQIDTASFIVKTTGITAATGEFKVMAKNHADGEWCDLPLTPVFVLAGADVTQPILLTDLCFTSIRLEFVSGAPTDDGTFSVWFQGEGQV